MLGTNEIMLIGIPIVLFAVIGITLIVALIRKLTK